MNKRMAIAGSCLLIFVPSLSYGVEGYYSPGKERLEFSVVVELSEKTVEHEDWSQMVDIKGRRFLVSPRVTIQAEDVDGIRVKRSGSPEFEEYDISVYFKRKSWAKIRETTEKLIGEKLGIIRRDKLIFAPVVREAIERQAQITGRLRKADIELVLEGFALTYEPTQEERDREYLQWLKQQADASPKDINASSRLAYEYLNRAFNGKEDFGKAASLLENVLEKDPSNDQHRYYLGIAYYRMRKYDEAIEMYVKVLVNKQIPMDEWNIRGQLAEIYKAKGDNHKALKELEKALKLAETMPRPEGISEKHYKDHKDRVTEKIESQIEEIDKPMN